MSITNKTRKRLWGKSGNMCAFCKRELVFPGTESDDEVIIGDECHIHSKKSGGPRWDPSLSKKEIDSYENLILLCKVHHKVIDDQPASYPSIGLKRLKKKHERWVRENLAHEKDKLRDIKLKKITRIRYGKDILSIVANAHFFDFEYDEPVTKEEVDLLTELLQVAQDFGDLGETLEFGARVNLGAELTSTIEELESNSYLVFGGRVQRMLKVAGKKSPWDFAVLRIFRKDNPKVIKNFSPN